MKPRSRRIIGLVLVVIAWLWLGFAQLLIWTTPFATASEAPDRHLVTKDSITKKETYTFAFALARDVENRSPNILLPAGLLFAGAWLFFSSRPFQLRSSPDDNTRNA